MVIKDVVIESIFGEISDLIKKAKENVSTAVNSEFGLLYWNIGKKIKKSILKNRKPEYGKQVVHKLTVRKKDVLAYLNERNEEEIIYLYDHS